MPGYTKAQLTNKKIDLASYDWCRRCRLYWHRRAEHVHSVMSATSTNPVSHPGSADAAPETKPLGDREKELLDWLVDEEIKRWLLQCLP
jgi:hypothetical protein